MGECEKAARSRGLLQSHSAFAQTSEDFEDSPSISGYGDKTLSEKDWAKLLLQGSVQSNMGDVDDLHPPLGLHIASRSVADVAEYQRQPISSCRGGCNTAALWSAF